MKDRPDAELFAMLRRLLPSPSMERRFWTKEEEEAEEALEVLRSRLQEIRRDADARGAVARAKSQVVDQLQRDNAELEIRLEDATSAPPR